MALTVLQNDQLKLEILPEVGASIVTFAARLGGRWVPILRPTPPSALNEGRASNLSCFLLVPYSNRIRDARFRFEGKSYQLKPTTDDGHAMHGDVRNRPFEVTESGTSCVWLRFESNRVSDLNFPFPFAVNIGYELDGATLRAELEVRNSGSTSMPAGMGFHPYYSRTLTAPDEQVTLQVKVGGVYNEIMPTVPAVPISAEQDFSRERPLLDAEFDTCFAGWDGRATIHWPGSKVTAEIECEPPLRHVILFTPRGKPFFALEPVSNANDGFNLFDSGDEDSGVRVLEPGQTMAASFRLHVRT